MTGRARRRCSRHAAPASCVQDEGFIAEIKHTLAPGRCPPPLPHGPGVPAFQQHGLWDHVCYQCVHVCVCAERNHKQLFRVDDATVCALLPPGWAGMADPRKRGSCGFALGGIPQIPLADPANTPMDNLGSATWPHEVDQRGTAR